MESIRREGVEYLLDGAHNLDGVEALASHVEQRGIDPQNVILVFGAMRDKAWQAMIQRLRSLSTERIYVEPCGRAAVSPDDLSGLVPGRGCTTVPEAIEVASMLARPDGLVVICGSLYLVAEARAGLLSLTMDRIVAL